MVGTASRAVARRALTALSAFAAAASAATPPAAAAGPVVDLWSDDFGKSTIYSESEADRLTIGARMGTHRLEADGGTTSLDETETFAGASIRYEQRPKAPSWVVVTRFDAHRAHAGVLSAAALASVERAYPESRQAPGFAAGAGWAFVQSPELEDVDRVEKTTSLATHARLEPVLSARTWAMLSPTADAGLEAAFSPVVLTEDESGWHGTMEIYAGFLAARHWRVEGRVGARREHFRLDAPCGALPDCREKSRADGTQLAVTLGVTQGR